MVRGGGRETGGFTRPCVDAFGDLFREVFCCCLLVRFGVILGSILDPFWDYFGFLFTSFFELRFNMEI